MRRVIFFGVATMLVATMAAAQTPAVVCTDDTRTVCTAKKNQPFTLSADPADPTAEVPTEKWRLYLDGARVAEQVNTGSAPLFPFPSGLATTGSHTLYLEAIGSGFNDAGAAVEIASGPSNVVQLTVATGSLTAPKNLRVVGSTLPSGGQ